jgi:hypothetical protein
LAWDAGGSIWYFRSLFNRLTSKSNKGLQRTFVNSRPWTNTLRSLFNPTIDIP